MPPMNTENYENTPSPEATEWIRRYNSQGDPYRVILDENGIAMLNEEIRKNCPTMWDMRNLPSTMAGETVRGWVENGEVPRNKVDRDGIPFSATEITSIEENRNGAAIPESVTPQTAIATTRANVRTVPTTRNFYNTNDPNRYYDRIQETELIPGTPVLVLHESLDGIFYYIQFHNYRGWVEKTHIALADRTDYERFLQDNANMVCITADVLEPLPNVRLDMGAAFPCIAASEDRFTIEIPRRDENGRLTTETADVSKSDAHYGRLPYTIANLYTQAFKFLGTTYSWGGYNSGVDCSGFVCAIFRSFGIILPRNTDEQKEFSGIVTPLSGASNDDIRIALGQLTAPTTIHRPGHVMLYLGIIDDTIYVIHAPSGGQIVSTTALHDTTNLISASTMDSSVKNRALPE